MADYGSSRRRARAGLVSMGYRQQGGYPIMAYPIQGSSAVYANPSYGSADYQDKGFVLPLLSALTTGVSQHFLEQDKITANATAQKAALEIEAIEAANRPYMILAGTILGSVLILGFVAAINAPKAKSKPVGNM